MKKSLIISIVLVGLATVQGQERLSREECLKYAFIATVDLKEMLKTPIPTDPDVKRPAAVREGDYGGLVLPESKLTAEIIAKAGKAVVPVGQLWLVKLAPLVDGQVVAADKLRMVNVKHEDNEVKVPCCALGVRKTDDGGLELLVYGKDTEPVLRTSLKASASSQQENPIEVNGERKENGALVTLKFFGKYEASFMVTDPELY